MMVMPMVVMFSTMLAEVLRAVRSAATGGEGFRSAGGGRSTGKTVAAVTEVLLRVIVLGRIALGHLSAAMEGLVFPSAASGASVHLTVIELSAAELSVA